MKYLRYLGELFWECKHKAKSKITIEGRAIQNTFQQILIHFGRMIQQKIFSAEFSGNLQ